MRPIHDGAYEVQEEVVPMLRTGHRRKKKPPTDECRIQISMATLRDVDHEERR
jgi:hypothetical protein